MRIIDKNQDYYDYLQCSTDKLVFDRRGSYLLTKEAFCAALRFTRFREDSKYSFITLQCGASYWLFLATLKDYDKSIMFYKDYDLEILTEWKNYDKPIEILKIDNISFKYMGLIDYKTHDYDYNKIIKHIDDFKDAINQNNIIINNNINNNHDFNHHKISHKNIEVNYPLLKACGIGKIVDPVIMFCAIEEYYSLEKMSQERTEAIGTTNNDKITMHGFDTKTSFRGDAR
jgi:hypothetical protein